MSKEYLATKLISGRSDASQKTQWWPRHSRAMNRYRELAWGDGDEVGLRSVQNLMISGCKEWEVDVMRSSKPGLMEEHAALEIELINAVRRVDAQKISRIGDLLLRNVRQQTELHAVKLDHFPMQTWHELLQLHVKLFTEMAQYHMENDGRNFEECERRQQMNTLALASFTAEWL